MKKLGKKGFTIIELMISTAVFSSILLICLTAITQVGRMYYKGITTAKTQEIARQVLDEISQQIQFSGGGSVITGSIQTASGTSNNVFNLCIGTVRYTLLHNQQVSDNIDLTKNKALHALWRDVGTCSPVSPAVDMANRTPSTGGVELIPPNSRIANMNITDLGTGAYSVTVRVVTGDQDLLDATDLLKTSCNGSQIGTQFCATSELSTIVTKRVK